MISLTHKQADCLDYIKWYIGQRGAAPSFQEMMEHLDLSSKSGVHRLVRALEERGHIRVLRNRARAIEIISHQCCPTCGRAA